MSGRDGLRSPRPSGTTEPSACRAPVQPALELGESDEDAAATADDAQLTDDVLVEVVPAHAENAGGFVGAEREPRPEPCRSGFAIVALARLLGLLDRHDLELELLRGHLARHDPDCSRSVTEAC